jgi:hypothetical protein
MPSRPYLSTAPQGGYGGWPCQRVQQQFAVRDDCHPYFDGGTRARNDVWVTRDAQNWTLLTGYAPWGARAWAAGAVWHFPGNSTLDVGQYGRERGLRPKMYVTGGVYYGVKYRAFAETPTADSIAIDSRTKYLDVWWSRDGESWFETSFKTGTPRNRDEFSTSECYLTSVNDEPMYLGAKLAANPFTRTI